MKKVLLGIAAAIIVLPMGGCLSKSSKVETPPKKERQILIPTVAQRGEDGQVITEDSDKWDPSKGFFITYVSVE